LFDIVYHFFQKEVAAVVF